MRLALSGEVIVVRERVNQCQYASYRNRFLIRFPIMDRFIKNNRSCVMDLLISRTLPPLFLMLYNYIIHMSPVHGRSFSTHCTTIL